MFSVYWLYFTWIFHCLLLMMGSISDVTIVYSLNYLPVKVVCASFNAAQHSLIV